MRSLNKTTDSVKEPVSYEELKEFLRIDFDDEKKLIKSIGKTARMALETWMERALITQTWKLTTDYFPILSARNVRWWDGVREGSISDLVTSQDYIPLQMGRIQSVDSFTTYANDNTSSTFDASNYFVDANSEPGRVVLNHGATWPTGLRDRNAIEITYKVGYGDNPSDIPEVLKTAVLIFANEIYEKRCDEGKVPQLVKDIASPYKVIVLG